MLNDPDPKVRSAAAWLIGGEAGMAVVREMEYEAKPAALAAILGDVARAPGRPMGVAPGRFLDHEDPIVRAAAVTAHAATGGDLSQLVPRLEDPSLRVRKAAAQALAGSDTGRGLLIGVLGEGSVMATEAALRAVSPIRDADSESFLAWAGGEARRAARLDGYRRAIEGGASSLEERFLVDVLTRRADRLVQWVLLAMTTEETRRVMPIVSRGVRSADPETNSQAIEALETLGARSVLEVLLPLLESEESPSVLDRKEALRQLSDDFDPWLRSLAALSLTREAGGTADPGAVPGWDPMSPEPSTDLDDMGRVLVIQAVPMFSGLDPEDLLLVARATTEVHFDSGERIYREGDPGTELLLIVGGAAEVTRSRGEQRQIIETYSQGEHVGELSLLYGGDRSADVDAGPEGLHGLILSKTDLISILEERPSVALGMLSTLARRLVDQT
jgi:CRP-like cAMP-binding protein